MVYLNSDVENKVTFFCIISILVLLTHIHSRQALDGADGRRYTKDIFV